MVERAYNEGKRYQENIEMRIKKDVCNKSKK